MQLTIFNVGHGSCGYLVADNNNVALFDCGCDDTIGFYPSRYLRQIGVTGIAHFYLSHYDQDHVSDLPNLLAMNAYMPLGIVYTNRSMTPEEILRIKLRGGPLEPGVEAAINLTTQFSLPLTPAMQAPYSLGGLTVRTFYNDYPRFEDTNNLSLVTFVHHPQLSIVLPGDLEDAGWVALLTDPEFRFNLQQVDVFVASHHGRANGYLEEVFNYCTPDIIIISDTAIQFDTQEHNYRRHATGLPWNNGSEVRYVLTTRHDGNVTIRTNPDRGYHITTWPWLT